MKQLKIFSVTLLLITFLSQSSFASLPDDPASELRTVVLKLLTKPDLHADIDQNVRISFFVTADDELVVLKTDARNKALDKFIKERMNYQKIRIRELEVNRIVHIKVHFLLNKEA